MTGSVNHAFALTGMSAHNRYRIIFIDDMDEGTLSDSQVKALLAGSASHLNQKHSSLNRARSQVTGSWCPCQTQNHLAAFKHNHSHRDLLLPPPRQELFKGGFGFVVVLITTLGYCNLLLPPFRHKFLERCLKFITTLFTTHFSSKNLLLPPLRHKLNSKTTHSFHHLGINSSNAVSNLSSSWSFPIPVSKIVVAPSSSNLENPKKRKFRNFPNYKVKTDYKKKAM